MPDTRIEWGILGVGLIALVVLAASIGLSLRDGTASTAAARRAHRVTAAVAPAPTSPSARRRVATPRTPPSGGGATRRAGAPSAGSPSPAPRASTTPGTRPAGAAAAVTPTAPTRKAAGGRGAGAETARVRLTLVASRGDSWLEVHSGSAGGRVLFSGTLTQGTTRVFRGERLWVRFGGASNLDARLNGRPLGLRFGTYDTLVTPKGLASPT